MSPYPLEFRVYNPEIGDAVERFRMYLVERLRAGQPVPVEEILNQLPFGPMGGTTREDLLARGAVSVLSETLLGNDGPEFFGSFSDAKLGDIAIYFPETVRASFAVSGGNCSIVFEEPVECVLYILPTLIGDLRRSANQILYAIYAMPNEWRYLFSTQDNPNEGMNIVIDFRGVCLEVGTRGYLLPPTLRKRRTLAACCPNPDKHTHVNLRSEPLKLPVHVRRVVDTTTFSVADMIQALNKTLYESGTGVIAQLASDKHLEAQEFEQIETPKFELASATHKMDELYKKRDGIPDDEVCVYVVKKFVLADGTEPTYVGVGEQPGESAVIKSECSRYTLAHEVGHTLGLRHNNQDGSLMYPITLVNPPHTPLILQNEVNTLRSSSLLKPA